MRQTWFAERSAALRRLSEFVPKAGNYGRTRNTDYGPEGEQGVSMLSPYLSNRLLSEAEVLEATLERYAPSTIDKYVQEVCWRSYWKGWLEMRPQLWQDYRDDVVRLNLRRLEDPEFALRLEAAEEGRTGLDGFDSWVRELREQGWLHNHTRMWFASIWVFTLELPWQLGAEFFRQQLLDADAASNTLSWRWVAGLHTQGKHYLARSLNIFKYTDGRFSMRGKLREHAQPMQEERSYERQPLPSADVALPEAAFLLWLHPDDYGSGLEHLPLAEADRIAVGMPRWMLAEEGLSEQAIQFQAHCSEDVCVRIELDYGVRAENVFNHSIESLTLWSQQLELQHLVAPFLPQGWVRDRMYPCWGSLGFEAHYLLREWDRLFWPHARAGFFQLKKRIPELLPEALSPALF